MATSSALDDWQSKGFARDPEPRVAGPDGLLIYRCWGGTLAGLGSTEIGKTGLFSVAKPKSVLDAELRFNIADWGNAVHFVSTFALKAGAPYFIGPVANGSQDLSKRALQVYVPGHLTMVTLKTSREVLAHDVTVVQLNDGGTKPGQERGQA